MFYTRTFSEKLFECTELILKQHGRTAFADLTK
jgi:hypothetical protein